MEVLADPAGAAEDRERVGAIREDDGIPALSRGLSTTIFAFPSSMSRSRERVVETVASWSFMDLSFRYRSSSSLQLYVGTILEPVPIGEIHIYDISKKLSGDGIQEQRLCCLDPQIAVHPVIDG